MRRVPPSPRERRRGRALRLAVSLVSVAAMLTVALPADGVEPDGGTHASPRASATVNVQVSPKAYGKAVPSEFLGLSFELSSAGQISEYANRGDLALLLRSLGPGVLRFGGASADTRVAWVDAMTPRPTWASSVLDMADLQKLRRLAMKSGWHVLLTLGLAHYDPRAAAREVKAAASALGPWLEGIEVGNEPDSYGRHGLRALPWTPSAYEAEVSAYRRAIARVTPNIAIAGPGVSGSRAFQRWGVAEARRQHPALLTGHHYPLRCDSEPPPTIEALLGARTREKESQSLARFVAVARASATPFRLDETNTVSCGGRAGISNTFASALWAVGYIAKTMAAGAAGINLEGNPANCLGYSPLCATTPARLQAGALHAQPEWYALLLSKFLVGDRPVPSQMVSSRHRNLVVSALRTPGGGLHFVIVEDDPHAAGAVTVDLHVGKRFHAFSTLALRAPSLAAQSSVTFGGNPVASDGSWAEHSLPHPKVVQEGTVSLTVPAASAMLVTVTPTVGTR